MKAAAIALRRLFTLGFGALGLEGLFLVLATVCLAIFAASITPAGPWLVVGAMALLVSMALALPARRE